MEATRSRRTRENIAAGQRRYWRSAEGRARRAAMQEAAAQARRDEVREAYRKSRAATEEYRRDPAAYLEKLRARRAATT